MLFFEILQKTFSKSFMLYHFVAISTLCVMLNTFKELDIDVIVFHSKNNIVLEPNK